MLACFKYKCKETEFTLFLSHGGRAVPLLLLLFLCQSVLWQFTECFLDAAIYDIAQHSYNIVSDK